MRNKNAYEKVFASNEPLVFGIAGSRLPEPLIPTGGKYGPDRRW